METLDLTKFDPTTAELNALVEQTSKLKDIDLEDKTALVLVKSNRIQLRDARVAITKKGKELRDDANKFSKAVIEKEKELIAIITPEEERLQSIEDESAKIIEIKKREKELPERKERLVGVANISDEEILKMDSTEFDVLVNAKKAEILDKQRAELEAREQAVRDAELKAQREQELKDAEERARVQERERMEREQKEKEAREVAEREKLAKEKDYQKFLSENGYTEETKDEFKLINEAGESRLYRYIATYKSK